MTTPEPSDDPLFSVAGRTVLVTGASSGLGAHFAAMLAARGASKLANSSAATQGALRRKEKKRVMGIRKKTDLKEK